MKNQFCVQIIYDIYENHHFIKLSHNIRTVNCIPSFEQACHHRLSIRTEMWKNVKTIGVSSIVIISLFNFDPQRNLLPTVSMAEVFKCKFNSLIQIIRYHSIFLLRHFDYNVIFAPENFLSNYFDFGGIFMLNFSKF